jgi:hypothetical protein
MWAGRPVHFFDSRQAGPNVAAWRERNQHSDDTTSGMNHRVTPKARELILHTWQSQANLALFLAMLVVTVFMLPAINVKHEHIVLYSNVVYSLVLASGVAIGWGRPRLFALAAVVASPALVLRWVAWAMPTPGLEIWAEAFSLLSVVVIAYVLLAQVFRDGPINLMRVQGAVAAYLLIGVGFAYGYQIDSRLNPASVESTVGKMTTFVDWVYFSFCTLSTVGYGDIVPTSRLSRTLAIGEGISGQLFLAILIARLVAMQVSASDGQRTSN